MKKLTSILLTISLLASGAMLANANYIEGGEDIIQGDIMLISETDETMPIAEGEETADAEETEEAAEVPSSNVEKQVVSGVVTEVSDTQITLENNVLNISDYTYIGDYEFNPIEEIKAGDEVTAIVSMAQTMSIPPQSYAFYVLAKTDEAQAAPLYATVDSVTDEFIAAGDYELYYENSETSMFKVKSIIKPQDLTEGSEIVFYADMMTMSIPAIVNPSKILVLSVAGADAVSYLQENGILLGSDKGLELTRDVTRAEAVTFLSRISPAARATTEMLPAFNDVPEGYWATDAITWALNANIVEGDGAGNFLPLKNVSGREFVKMLLSMQGDTEVTIENAYEKGVDAGIVDYLTASKVSENEDLTRNDVAMLLYNAIAE